MIETEDGKLIDQHANITYSKVFFERVELQEFVEKREPLNEVLDNFSENIQFQIDN